MSTEPTREPWLEVQPGPRIMAHYGRAAGTPYTGGGSEWLPWPDRPGFWARFVADAPDAEAEHGGGMVCTTLGQYLTIASYPNAQWTTPDEVPGNGSTWGRMASWALGEHLSSGGTLANAEPDWVTDPLDVLVDLGVAKDRRPLEEVPVGRWACVQGWKTTTAGHFFVVFRVSEDLWLRLHSAGAGVQRDWKTTAYLTNAYPLYLEAAPLRGGVPEHLKRPEE